MNGLGRVSIIGGGQVGTTIGMALRDRGPTARADEVTVHDRDEGVADASVARGAADRAVDLDAALDADVVVLAVPVPEIVRVVEAVAERLRPRSLLIDTGSAKRATVDAMRRCVPSSVHAVGGHPMAGTERPGPAGADPRVLRGATFWLCPVREDAAAMQMAEAFVRALGAEPVVVQADTHDAALARTSHLAHVGAFAMALAAGSFEGIAGFASPGFLDATRLAASDPSMVAGFLDANADEVRGALRRYRAELDRIDAALDEPERSLVDVLVEGRRARAALAAGSGMRT